MEIQKIFSSYDEYGYEDERLYSVLMSEDELYYLQREFGRAAQRKKKQKSQRYADARAGKGMTAAKIVSPESQGRGHINTTSARQAAILGAVPTEEVAKGNIARPIVDAANTEGVIYEKGTPQQKAQAQRTVAMKERHNAPVAKVHRRGISEDVKHTREMENQAARAANQQKYERLLKERYKNRAKDLSDQLKSSQSRFESLQTQLGSNQEHIKKLTDQVKSGEAQLSEYAKKLADEQAKKKAVEELSNKTGKRLRKTQIGAGLALLGVGGGMYALGRRKSNQQQ